MTCDSGELFLIPTALGEKNVSQVLSQQIFSRVQQLNYFIVENEKNARRFIKTVCPEKSQAKLKFFTINKHIDRTLYDSYFEPIKNGHSIGLISDAGAPAVADPGAEIVLLAHQKNVLVRPLAGPSSILLALMSSGMNGQNFAFNGYLPIENQERRKTIKELEARARRFNQTQIFMETPYRNDQLIADILMQCAPNTLLTIACDITQPQEYIKTQRIIKWRREKISFHKRPCIFCLYKVG